MNDKPGMVQDPGGCLMLLALCAIGALMWGGIIWGLVQILAATK